jgi:hypothetical protein
VQGGAPDNPPFPYILTYHGSPPTIFKERVEGRREGRRKEELMRGEKEKQERRAALTSQF